MFNKTAQFYPNISFYMQQLKAIYVYLGKVA